MRAHCCLLRAGGLLVLMGCLAGPSSMPAAAADSSRPVPAHGGGTGSVEPGRPTARHRLARPARPAGHARLAAAGATRNEAACGACWGAPPPAGTSGIFVTVEPVGTPAPDQGAMRVPAPSWPAGMLRSTVGLHAVRLPNGTMMLDLQGRFLEFTAVRIDSCGRTEIRCVHGASARSALDSCGAPGAGRFEER